MAEPASLDPTDDVSGSYLQHAQAQSTNAELAAFRERMRARQPTPADAVAPSPHVPESGAVLSSGGGITIRSVASGAADIVGSVASGAGGVVSAAADGIGPVLEGAGGAADGCGSCSLAFVLFFLAAGSAVAAVIR